MKNTEASIVGADIVAETAMTSFNPVTMSRRYRMALQRYLKQDDHTKLAAAHALGVEFQVAGVDIEELAKLHEDVLVTKALLGCSAIERSKIIRMAGNFYAAVITPLEKAGNGRTEVIISRGKLIEQLSRRTIELAVSNIERRLEMNQRAVVETELRQKELNCRQLLEQESHLRLHSRQLSHRLLSLQKDERKRISRELHDVIAQTLLGINLLLAVLQQKSDYDSASHGESITKTQNTVRMIIHDDGRSFKPQHILTKSGPYGLGLIGMRERIEMVDGTFQVDSQPGKGTTITAEIPLQSPGKPPVNITKEAA